MLSLNVAARRLLCTAIVVFTLTSCARVSRVHPPVPEEAGAHRLVQIAYLATRQEIIALGVHYEHLIASGINDADLVDGSLAAGRVYCCGGVGENLHIWLYVPTGMAVDPGDIVEVKMGRQPGNGNRGAVNTATQIRHKKAVADKHCRWDPPTEGLWMRILYCDWMEGEGWIERAGLNKTWLKPASPTGGQ